MPDTKVDVASEQRRLKLAWIGLATYFLIFLNAIRYVDKVPYQIFVLGFLLNATIITVIILCMRRSYQRISKARTSR